MAAQETGFAEALGQGAQLEGSSAPGSSGSSAGAGGCGIGMRGMMHGSPCGAVLQRHRGAIRLAMAGMLLGIAILQAGWLLGVIAFFRTF